MSQTCFTMNIQNMKIVQLFLLKILKNTNPFYCKTSFILIVVIFDPTRGRVVDRLCIQGLIKY